MTSNEQMAEQFVELIARLVQSRPRLALPDERLALIRKQLRSLHFERLGEAEDRMFLFRILATLNRSDAPPTMGELSAQLGIPLSSATRTADNLVRAKLAERCPDPADRRIVRLCLTRNGRQFIELWRSFLKQRIGRVLDHFTGSEQQQLLHLAGKLIDSLEAEKNESPGK
jgi:DNA-binding MarR family transcriptional regulator